MVAAYVLVTAVTIGVLAAIVLTALAPASCGEARDYSPDPKEWGRPGDEPAFSCRPLFFAEDHGHARLDCLVTSDGPAAAAGAPVSLDVGLPDTGWLALAVESLLSEWADDQLVLDMSIAAHGQRLVVTNGESTIRLPLHATAGVARV
ncbi:MAG TPA: hypothetical protein VHN98_12830 [Acidimicrobiales bacterium]|nr:hypothetical protein [Acidimicrobiales bacterium]